MPRKKAVEQVEEVKVEETPVVEETKEVKEPETVEEAKAEVVTPSTEEVTEGKALTIRDMEVICYMILTEKSQTLLREQNVLTLAVKKHTKKSEVKHVVEKFYGVKVDSVRIMNCSGHERSVGRYTGKTASYRKAYCKVNKAFNLMEAAQEASAEAK